MVAIFLYSGVYKRVCEKVEMRAKGQPKPGNVNEHHSREGQAWSQVKAVVFNNELGTVVNLPIDHFNCIECGTIVRIDRRGYAFCVKCGTIYNDGLPPRRKKRQDNENARRVARSKLVRACKV